MTNWVEKLTGETTRSCLNLLRRSRLTITALADALHLTDNAVRTHIAALERDGIVQHVGTLRDTGGKPARVYALTGEGEELFPKAYARRPRRAGGRDRADGRLGAGHGPAPCRGPARGFRGRRAGRSRGPRRRRRRRAAEPGRRYRGPAHGARIYPPGVRLSAVGGDDEAPGGVRPAPGPSSRRSPASR